MELNGCMELPTHPMPNSKTIINGVAGWNVFLYVDVKAAYNSFPLDPDCQPYCPRQGVFVS